MESSEIFENRINLTDLQNHVEKIRTELNKVIVGQDDMIDFLLTAMFCGGHVLIEGVPGVAKTLTAKLIARTINTGFSRMQFTPDLMPSDVLGTTVFNIKTSEFEFRKGPVFSNIVLVDEINRAPAKTQAALFEVMEEHQVTLDGKSYPMSVPFIIIATQNPIEHEGTYRLPEGQLDRFMFKIKVGYPDKEQEIGILNGHNERKTLKESDLTQSVMTAEEIAAYQTRIRSIHVDPNLIRYIAEVVQNTRNNKSLYLGASPRAAIALLNASKSHAAINGRDFITPEDIQRVVYPVLRHRLMLTAEKEMEGISIDEVIKQIIQKIEVPR